MTKIAALPMTDSLEQRLEQPRNDERKEMNEKYDHDVQIGKLK